jgi:hypothetical protein
MIPVDQKIIDGGTGDCERAVIASLFGLQLEQVPHFKLFPDDMWFNVYWYFLYGLGYEYLGWGKPERQLEGVNGYVYAVVKSRTFPGKTHAVIVDEAGTVIHDPNPNRAYLGVNVKGTAELVGWHIIKKRNTGSQVYNSLMQRHARYVEAADEIVRLREALDQPKEGKQFYLALHASAPEGMKCADCQIDGEPCPACYSAWWRKRNPNVVLAEFQGEKHGRREA